MSLLMQRSGATCGCHRPTVPSKVQCGRVVPLPLQRSPFKPALLGQGRQLVVEARAERSEGVGEGGSFTTGFIIGGVVFGTLGFLFAPQISKALLGDDQRLKLPRFMDDEAAKDPEATKQDLIEKIAQLNSSIDEVASQLKAKDTTAGSNGTLLKADAEGMKILL